MGEASVVGLLGELVGAMLLFLLGMRRLHAAAEGSPLTSRGEASGAAWRWIGSNALRWLSAPLPAELAPKQVRRRPRAPDRQTREAILFVLHTGIQREWSGAPARAALLRFFAAGGHRQE